MAQTFGRFPTYSEIREYYTRDDVLDFINDAAGVRKVILSFKEEPSIYSEGESPRLESAGVDRLKEHIIEEFARMLPERVYSYDKPLQAYPSLHFITRGGEDSQWDFIMEADCHGWRRSFVDVRGVVELLHKYEVPFISKFSGHRSLHLIVPYEAFPKEFRGQPIENIWKQVDSGLRSFFSHNAFVRRAHGTGGLLRLPYSLNENTGMVSLPILYEELDAFRPWESFYHLIRVKEELRLSNFIQECRDRSDKTAEFLSAVLDEKSISALSGRIWSFSMPEGEKYAGIDATGFSDDAELAWRNLAMGVTADEEVIGKYKDETNPDIRWFMAESLMGDERSFDLLPENDEYARCAIEDSIALQANSSMSSFLDRYQTPGDYRSIRGIQAIMERLDYELLKAELLRRSEVSSEDELSQLVKLASVFSSVFRDWDISDKVTQQAMERFPGILDEIDQKVLEAVKGLEASGIKEIREAQRVLFEAGKKAAEQLLLIMTSDRSGVRRRAMEVISRMKDPAFIECLVNGLGDDSRRVRTMAIPALVSLGNAAKVQLEEAANSDNPTLRANAIRTLGYMEGEDALGVAVSGLESRDDKVRNAAVKSLGKMGGERARDALKPVLWDVSPRIGMNAAYTLVDFGPEGIRVLKEALAEAEAEGATKAAQCISHGLVEAGDESGLDHVISALYDEAWEEWSTPFIIAQMKLPRANDAIIKFFRDNMLQREEWNGRIQPHVRALAEVEDDRAASLLQEFLDKQTDKKALKSGVDALRGRATGLNDRKSIQALVQLARSDRRSLAQRAATALVKVGQAALSEVQEALAETEEDSRAWKLLDGALRQIAEA